MDKYEEIEKVGQGGFGVVYRCRNTVTGEIVAVKNIFFHECDGVPSSVIREVSLLKELDHINIVRLLEVLSTDNKVSLIFEYLDNDLKDFMLSFPSIVKDPQIIKRFLHQILSGVLYCHSNKIVHRDLKTNNLLVDRRNNVVKVADFGLARAVDIPLKSLTGKVGNFLFMAPEILLGSGQYSTPVDMWGVGCIFAEMVMKRHLFRGANRKDQLEKISSIMGTPDEQMWPGVTSKYPIVNTLAKFPAKDLATVIPSLEPWGIDLLSKMLRWNPSERITALDALKHKYFTDIQSSL